MDAFNIYVFVYWYIHLINKNTVTVYLYYCTQLQYRQLLRHGYETAQETSGCSDIFAYWHGVKTLVLTKFLAKSLLALRNNRTSLVLKQKLGQHGLRTEELLHSGQIHNEMSLLKAVKISV